MHQCTECEFVAKNAAGLKLHKKGSKCKKQAIAGIVATATDSIHAVKASAVKEVANQISNAAVSAATNAASGIAEQLSDTDRSSTRATEPAPPHQKTTNLYGATVGGQQDTQAIRAPQLHPQFSEPQPIQDNSIRAQFANMLDGIPNLQPVRNRITEAERRKANARAIAEAMFTLPAGSTIRPKTSGRPSADQSAEDIGSAQRRPVVDRCPGCKRHDDFCRCGGGGLWWGDE